MSITNGYTTLAQIKTYLQISSTDPDDDGLLERCVEAASRAIDKHTARTFYGRTETRLYDLPRLSELGRVLYLDDDLLTVTTLTNGDSTIIAAADYLLLPYNASPKYGLMLKPGSGVDWQPDVNGNTRSVISVAGTWGYSTTAPADIEQVCLMIAADLYKARTGQGEQAAQITSAGVVLRPSGIPATAREILRQYARNVV